MQLDGLRGVAALVVLLFHAPASLGLRDVMARGYLMVDLFFLLSGFVLARVAEPRLAAGMGTGAFMRTRFRRLWPMIAVGVLVGAAVGLLLATRSGFTLDDGWRHLQWTVLALLMVPLVLRDRPGALYPLNQPHWSLLFELVANLAHAALLWRLRDRAVLALALAFGAALLAVVMVQGHNDSGPYSSNWMHAVPRLGFAYCLGIWLGRRWRPDAGGVRLPWWLALALPVMAVALVPMVPVARWIGDTVLVLVVLPALFWLAACSTAPARAAPALALLGAMSYPLYAVHMPVLRYAAMTSTSPGAAAVAVLVAIGLALVLALVFERRRRPRTGGAA